MLTRKYEMPWRRAYEGYAALAWAASFAFFAHAWVRMTLPWQIAAALAVSCLLMAVRRGAQALRILTVRASLSGHAMEVISTERLRGLTAAPEQMFIGFGFEWQPKHSQRLYELAKVDWRAHALSPWLMRLLGYRVDPQPDAEQGLPYIHGVEPQETPLYRPLANFEGGTLIVGTTQSGKGVVLGNLITQAIRRGDVVIVIDPKNSERLKRVILRACADYREPGTFLEFHPAFPDRGVRLDFMYNWGKPTELASRIQSVLPPDTTGSFAAFAWDAVNAVVQGMVLLDERPNLLKISRYVEGGIEPLLEASLRRFLDTRCPGWRETPQLRKLLQAAERNPRRSPEAGGAELAACIAFYEQHVAPGEHLKVIDSQIRIHHHNREHYQKITANLVPTLSMLTSGELGRSLSPDPFDPADARPIMNFEKVERAGHVLLMHLDSLPDPPVASTIAGLALADLAARAGMRYNLGGQVRRASLFVDEASECMNAPLIQLMNKGAESGIHTTVAMQTLSDLAHRMGSEHAARMALGNLNNLIALRSKCRLTQDFIVETFGRTGIHSVRSGISTGADTHLGDFSTGHSTLVDEAMDERVPADILGALPNLQYFGSVSGRRLIKGRFPILDPGSP